MLCCCDEISWICAKAFVAFATLSCQQTLHTTYIQMHPNPNFSCLFTWAMFPKVSEFSEPKTCGFFVQSIKLPTAEKMRQPAVSSNQHPFFWVGIFSWLRNKLLLFSRSYLRHQKKNTCESISQMIGDQTCCFSFSQL